MVAENINLFFNRSNAEEPSVYESNNNLWSFEDAIRMVFSNPNRPVKFQKTSYLDEVGISQEESDEQNESGSLIGQILGDTCKQSVGINNGMGSVPGMFTLSMTGLKDQEKSVALLKVLNTLGQWFSSNYSYIEEFEQDDVNYWNDMLNRSVLNRFFKWSNTPVSQDKDKTKSFTDKPLQDPKTEELFSRFNIPLPSMTFGKENKLSQPPLNSIDNAVNLINKTIEVKANKSMGVDSPLEMDKSSKTKESTSSRNHLAIAVDSQYIRKEYMEFFKDKGVTEIHMIANDLEPHNLEAIVIRSYGMRPVFCINNKVLEMLTFNSKIETESGELAQISKIKHAGWAAFSTEGYNSGHLEILGDYSSYLNAKTDLGKSSFMSTEKLFSDLSISQLKNIDVLPGINNSSNAQLNENCNDIKQENSLMTETSLRNNSEKVQGANISKETEKNSEIEKVLNVLVNEDKLKSNVSSSQIQDTNVKNISKSQWAENISKCVDTILLDSEFEGNIGELSASKSIKSPEVNNTGNSKNNETEIYNKLVEFMTSQLPDSPYIQEEVEYLDDFKSINRADVGVNSKENMQPNQDKLLESEQDISVARAIREAAEFLIDSQTTSQDKSLEYLQVAGRVDEDPRQIKETQVRIVTTGRAIDLDKINSEVKQKQTDLKIES
jgi:hypothetical protein